MDAKHPISKALLEGIRVLDLTQYTPGPYATRLLSDLGAEVIKIEPPQGDPFRQMFKSIADDISPAYKLLNNGKQIAKIDLKDNKIVEQLYSVIAEADVLLESFRPGVMQRFGLDWDTCHHLNSKLVYCSLSGYGQDGPRASASGHDINYSAAAGLFSFTEEPHPILPLVADHTGSMNAVNTILAGLVKSARTGQGSYHDVSLYEAILSWQYLANTSIADSECDELKLLNGGAACYNIYATKDNRYITLGALEPKFWQNFCKALNQPNWITRQLEPFPQSNLIAEVQKIIAQNDIIYWIDKLGETDCCFEPIPTVNELYAHLQTQSRNIAGQGAMAFPGKINHQICQNTDKTIFLEPHQIPKWKL